MRTAIPTTSRLGHRSDANAGTQHRHSRMAARAMMCGLLLLALYFQYQLASTWAASISGARAPVISGLMTDSPPGFSRTGALNYAREYHTATRLADGRVLIAGGGSALAEFYSPSSGMFITTGQMAHDRVRHSATLLQDGKVLIIGGYNPETRAVDSSAELYDPSTGRFSPTGSLAQVRQAHTATLLENGEVLVCGGRSDSATLASAELYNPNEGHFRSLNSMLNVPRYGAAAVSLSSGNVLIVGGTGPGFTSLSSAELFDLSTQSFAFTMGQLHVGRQGPTAIKLLSGSVLVASQLSAEVYNPSLSSFSTVPGSLMASRLGAQSALLETGEVLIAGGTQVGSWCAFNSLGDMKACNDYEDVYNPSTGTLHRATSVPHPPMMNVSVTALTNGSVLLAGNEAAPPLSNASPIPTALLYKPLPTCSAPSVTSGPRSTLGNQLVVLSVAADALASIYQWYEGSISDTTQPILGATSSILIVRPSRTTAYWVRVFSQCGASVDAGPVTATVTPLSSTSVRAIGLGFAHTCATSSDGSVKCWGHNDSGQLGDGTRTNRITPVLVSSLQDIVAIAAGNAHTCALTGQGGVKCWGLNVHGALGDGTTADRASPVDVVGVTSGIVALAAGWYHTCALSLTGVLKCWGYNYYYQLGTGEASDHLTPIDVDLGGAKAIAVAAGEKHTCALTSDGAVKCWGTNSSSMPYGPDAQGAVGDGTSSTRTTPVAVVGITGSVRSVAAGAYHNCVVTVPGDTSCWGWNTYGTLGDGTTDNRLSPIMIDSGTLLHVSPGYSHTCALTTAGGVTCWGGNSYGQLGSAMSSSLRPHNSTVFQTGAAVLGAGGYHTCVITDSGGLKCWGSNEFGQLGDGTTTSSATPVDVIGFAAEPPRSCSTFTVAVTPTTTNVVSGNSATLRAATTPFVTSTYQWYRGTSGDLSSPIPGATSSSYPTPPLTSTTSYWVRVTNSCGDTADSATATVTVKIIPRPIFDSPTLPDATAITLSVGVSRKMILQASHPDTGQLVTITASQLPAGGSFSASAPGNPATATFEWTPNPNDVGTRTVTFTATATGTDAAVSRSYAITVWAADPVGVIGLAMEVTQGVQNLRSDAVPLIAHKPTRVIVHVKSASGEDIPNVTATLTGTATDGRRLSGNPLSSTIAVGTTVTSSLTVPANPTSYLTPEGFVFHVPNDWLSGTVTLVVSIAGHSFTCVADNPTCGQKNVTFLEARVPTIRVIKVVWAQPDGTLHVPQWDDFRRAREAVKLLWPVADVFAGTWSGELLVPSKPSDFSAILDSLHSEFYKDCLQSSSATCRNTYVLGLLVDWTLDQNGKVLPSNSVVQTGEARIRRHVATAFGDAPLAVTHELSHAAGMFHVKSTNREPPGCEWWRGLIPPFQVPCETGYSPAGGRIGPSTSLFGDMTTVLGRDWAPFETGTYISLADDTYSFDVMTYESRRWMSPYTIGALLERELAPESPHASVGAVSLRSVLPAAQQAFVVSGRVSPITNSGMITRIEHVTLTESVVTLPTGRYGLRLENATGEQLGLQQFEASNNADDPTSAGFSILVPWSDGTARMVLLQDGNELDSKTASASAPAVQLISPNGGEHVGSSSFTVSWNGTDADGDALEYQLQYSTDGGTSWRVIAAGLRGQSYVVDSIPLAGSAQAKIKVVATDGFLSSEDESDGTLVVERHAPTVRIAAPNSGVTYVGDVTVSLEGQSIDAEDGEIDDARLRWSSDKSGDLGTGRHLLVRASSLAEGSQIITLTATDSDSQTGVGTIEVTIARSQLILAPHLSVIPTSATISAPVGTAALSRELTIQNTGDGRVSWAATSDADWIKLDRTSGTAPSTVHLSIDVSGLSGGSYDGKVTVAGSDHSPELVEVPIRLNLQSIAASPPSLRFGATKAGANGDLQTVTPEQAVTVNMRGATTAWRASGDQPWIQIVNGTGTGSGRFTVRIINPSNVLSAFTSATSTITVEAPALGLAITVRVDLAVQLDASTSAAPFGSFDTPVDGATGVTGSVAVTGWALDDIEVSGIRVCRDAVTGDSPALDARCANANEIYIGDAVLVAGARPDVEAIHPDAPFGYRAGWGYLLLTNMLPGQGNGSYVLHTYAEDREGHTVSLGSRRFTCDNAHASKPFGAIDTPEQGATIAGTSYINWGWALTPGTKTIPTDGSSITIFVDGVPVGHPVQYNLYRSDVATMFPGLSNSNGAIGYFVLDTTKYTNGVHTIAWGVVDDSGAAEGIGSRYFTIQNSSSALRARSDSVRSASAVLGGRGRAGVWFRTYGGEPEEVSPDGDGYFVVTANNLDALELDLGEEQVEGHQLVGATKRSLPVGSTFDPQRGLFTWQPGPAFLGTYELLFVNAAGEETHVRITLKPKA